MKLHEYQAKALLSNYGIVTPRGNVASTPTEAATIAKTLGGRVVVKAQIYAGARGKSGGIKIVDGPDAALKAASAMLGTRLVTPQTDAKGALVSRVLIEEAAQVAQEIYIAVTIDRHEQAPVTIGSASGGVNIEQIAALSPELVHRVVCDPVIGFQPFHGRRLSYEMGLPQPLVPPVSQLLSSLYRAFIEGDCSLIELNPLAVLKDGRLVALDAKITVDDNALFRHGALADQRDPTQEDPLEWEAILNGISYVTLEGDVGCLVNGAGLAMATLDVVREAGAVPANFLDVGGGAEQALVAQAMHIMLSDKKVKRLVVNIFGGILRCDEAALGLVSACREKGRTDLPVIARLLGTNAEEGRKILDQSELEVTFVEDLNGLAKALAAK